MNDSETLRSMLRRRDIHDQLCALGVQPGHVIMVHCAFGKIKDWIPGGVETFCEVLMELITPNGLIVMPTQTGNNSDPAKWVAPPVPEDWWPIIREEMPAYDPRTTVTREMGALAEHFRTRPDVIRSAHPQESFAAWGRGAPELLADHRLEYGFGERSPLAKFAARDGHVLLIGVNHANNTCLHLAEHRSEWPGKTIVSDSAAVNINGVRQWVTFTELNYDADDFHLLGADYEAAIGYTPGQIGQAETRYLRLEPLIDFAHAWFPAHRKLPETTPQAVE
jgi:aminoglycoside 3-N-acetyltransferase